jgi:hypothetical protein
MGKEMSLIVTPGCLWKYKSKTEKLARLDQELRRYLLLGKQFSHFPWTRYKRSRCKQHSIIYRAHIAQIRFQFAIKYEIMLMKVKLTPALTDIAPFFLATGKVFMVSIIKFLGKSLQIKHII